MTRLRRIPWTLRRHLAAVVIIAVAAALRVWPLQALGSLLGVGFVYAEDGGPASAAEPTAVLRREAFAGLPRDLRGEWSDALVVDDSHADLKLLAGILVGEGYDVRPVDSGELALASRARGTARPCPDPPGSVPTGLG